MSAGINKRSYLLLSLLLGILIITGRSQPATRGADDDPYPFVRRDLNFVDNHFKGLKYFFEQLYLLEQKEKRTVNVVHIGDSHIQADWFSGRLRTQLHKQFGSAGRGLVFPYRVAHTNSPRDISSYSNVNWQARRNVNSRPALPIGLSGITIKTRDSNFLLKLAINSQDEFIDYSFNKITLFTDKGPSNFDIRIGNSSETKTVKSAPASNNKHILRLPAPSQRTWHTIEVGETLSSISRKYKVSVEQLQAWNNIDGDMIYAGTKLIVNATATESEPITRGISRGEETEPLLTDPLAPDALSNFTSTIYLKEAMNTLYLRGSKSHAAQRQATIYGILLENYNYSGVLYNMIGVNGAKYEDYNASTHFYEQLQVLQPDLIIVSLGTNEANSYGFNPEVFAHEVDAFVHALEQNMPHANILITTPPDALRGRRLENPNIRKARDILLRYAIENDLACWDLYEIMGGNGAIGDWFRYGLAQTDKLHFTRKGYELQGNLLYEAIMEGYGSYRATRSR